MRIALIGAGTMGRLIRSLAREKGHEIVAVVDGSQAGASAKELERVLSGADVAIDFTVAGAVRRNVEACLGAGIPLVEGTTGWNAQRDEVLRLVRDRDGSFLYGSNFSVGVNLFFRMVDHAAALLSGAPSWDAFLEERHHVRKKDAPSGTALKVLEILSLRSDRPVAVSSIRAGEIPGTHTVGFDSAADTIELVHTARTRDGFAAGALLGAEWLLGEKGCHEFSEVLDDILRKSS